MWGKGKTCEAPGGFMYYRRSGAGPGLVLLHGLGGGSGYWEVLVRALLGIRTCLAPDLLGFGQSARPDLAYTSEAHVAALRAVIADAALAPPFDLIGHSAGGVLAIDLARALPGQVRSLALICAPYPKAAATTPRQLWPRRAAPPGSPLARRAQRRMAIASWLWRRLVTVYPPRGYPRAAVWNYLSYCLWAYLDTASRVLNGRDMARDTAALRELPVLLLYGTQDRQVPPSAAHQYQALFPRSMVRYLPAGHQLLIERHTSAAVVVAIREWLDRPGE